MTRRLGWTTIVIAPEVRNGLKHIARKDQSYNDLLEDLIRLHNDQNQNKEEVGGDEPPDQTRRHTLANQRYRGDDGADFNGV